MNNKEKELAHKWLEKILSVDFDGRDIVLEQLKLANMTLSRHYAYVDVEFHFEKDVPLLPWKRGVPISMDALQKNKAPIIFVLHVNESIITALEVCTADSSKLDIYDVELELLEHFVHRKHK